MKKSTISFILALILCLGFATPVFANETAPIIPSITVRPPEILDDDDLTVTLTYVYDYIIYASATDHDDTVLFSLTPAGSISFNRDVELIVVNYPTATGDSEELSVAADEVLNMSQFTMLSYPHSPGRALSFTVIRPPQQSPQISESDYPAQCGSCIGFCRVSNHAVTDTVTTLQNQTPTTTPPAVTTTPTPTPTPIPAAAADTAPARTLRFTIGNATFIDNGVNRTIEAAPFIANDRTMVPLRVIGEALGATNIYFDAGVVSFILNGENITMTIGQPLPGGMGTPVIVADRTFVPLAYVVDEMGAQVRWDGNARAVYIYID